MEGLDVGQSGDMSAGWEGRRMGRLFDDGSGEEAGGGGSEAEKRRHGVMLVKL